MVLGREKRKEKNPLHQREAEWSRDKGKLEGKVRSETLLHRYEKLCVENVITKEGKPMLNRFRN